MGNVTDKVASHALQLVLLGDILDEHESVVDAKTRELKLQAELGVWPGLDP